MLINKTPKINKPPVKIGRLPSKTFPIASKGVANVINDKNSDNMVVAYFKLFSPLLYFKMISI